MKGFRREFSKSSQNTTKRHHVVCIEGKEYQIVRLPSLHCQQADSRRNLASMRKANSQPFEERGSRTDPTRWPMMIKAARPMIRYHVSRMPKGRGLPSLFKIKTERLFSQWGD